MKNYYAFFIAFVFSAALSAQTYTGGSGPIADYNTTDFTLTVSGLSPATIDTNIFGLESVCVNLTHTWDADLDLRIIAPDGTSAMLTTGNGGAGDDYTNTCFTYTATTPIVQGSPPFTGAFIPQGQMGTVNNGQNGNGTWTLRVIDMVGQDVGDVLSWSVTFGNNPATYFSFSSSNLPVVVLNTNNQVIPDSPKIMCDMGIIYNGPGNRNYLSDPWNHYNGKIGIEMRGSSSQNMPKKPYGFELWDVNGNAIDSSILGMPKESDWVLIPAYSDKTLMRNKFTYWLWSEAGYYAPRGEPVEVILDGAYIGVYFLGEKIKRDDDRVDIAKLQPTDIYGDQLTGGYILKVDKLTASSANYWSSVYPPANNPTGAPVNIVVHYPTDANLVPQQLSYIHAYCDSFEIALNGPNFTDTATGYRHFANEASFVDYLLLTEFTKNLDGYRSSCYFFKDKNSNGGKLTMGPAWDYDLAYGNADFCDTWLTNGWAYEFNNVCPNDSWEVPFWWQRLLQDSTFAQDVRCRWEELKMTMYNPITVNHWIDSMAVYMNEGQNRNYQVWPIMGSYVWPNYYIAPDYQGEIDTLKWWIGQRYNWMDANLPGNAALCNVTGIYTNTNAAQSIDVFPNPFTHEINISLILPAAETVQLRLVNMLGEEVQPLQAQMHNGGLQQLTFTTAETLPPGIYFLSVSTSGFTWTKQIIKAE